MITSVVTVFPFVEGLHASCVPSSDFTLGDTMSMCEIPLSQPLHCPQFSLLASMPQLLYLAIAQSLAAGICGVPTSLGPISSSSSCARGFNWELLVASLMMLCMITESLLCAKVCVMDVIVSPNTVRIVFLF